MRWMLCTLNSIELVCAKVWTVYIFRCQWFIDKYIWISLHILTQCLEQSVQHTSCTIQSRLNADDIFMYFVSKNNISHNTWIVQCAMQQEQRLNTQTHMLSRLFVNKNLTFTFSTKFPQTFTKYRVERLKISISQQMIRFFVSDFFFWYGADLLKFAQVFIQPRDKAWLSRNY